MPWRDVRVEGMAMGAVGERALLLAHVRDGGSEEPSTLVYEWTPDRRLVPLPGGGGGGNMIVLGS